MLTVLLAASALAVSALSASPSYRYWDTFQAISPLITYNPRPSSVVHVSNGSSLTEVTSMIPPQAGWTVVDASKVKGFGERFMFTSSPGASYSFSLPDGPRMSVWGRVAGAVNVTFDGIRLYPPDVEVRSDRSTWGTEQGLRVQYPEVIAGEHNLTVTLSHGWMTVIRADTSSTWFYRLFPQEGEEWEIGEWGTGKPWNPNETQRGGTWTETQNAIVATEAGASVSITVPPSSSWVDLKGYSNGSYAVRCIPPAPNTTDTTYQGNLVDITGVGVHLYAAQLDPRFNYTLEVTHLANTTSLHRITNVRYVGKPRRPLDLRLPLSLGLGLGIPLAVAVVLIWGCVRGRRRANERREAQARARGASEMMGKAESDEDDAEPSPYCVVCVDGPLVFAVVECGHLCMCEACSQRIMDGEKACPVCGKGIVDAPKRIFRP